MKRRTLCCILQHRPNLKHSAWTEWFSQFGFFSAFKQINVRWEIIMTFWDNKRQIKMHFVFKNVFNLSFYIIISALSIPFFIDYQNFVKVFHGLFFLPGVQRHNIRRSGLWSNCWCRDSLQCHERHRWVPRLSVTRGLIFLHCEAKKRNWKFTPPHPS